MQAGDLSGGLLSPGIGTLAEDLLGLTRSPVEGNVAFLLIHKFSATISAV